MADRKISITAWTVVICILALRKNRRWRELPATGNEAFYKQCLRYGCSQSLVLRLASFIPAALRLKLIEWTVAKGAPQHYYFRKQAIATRAAASLQAGSQLVVIGGGFDALAIATANASPAITCFEIDTPAMNAHKLRVVNEFYKTPPANFNAIAADFLQHSLYQILSSNAAFDGKKSTIFVAEGVTMYLNDKAIRDLFADMRKLCELAPGIIFTGIEAHEKEEGAGKRVRDLVLAANSERFSWSVPVGRLASYLQNLHFTLRNLTGYAELQQQYRSAEEMLVLKRQSGEYVAYAIANPNS